MVVTLPAPHLMFILPDNPHTPPSSPMPHTHVRTARAHKCAAHTRSTVIPLFSYYRCAAAAAATENAIPISSWTGSRTDDELLDLLPVLDALHNVGDVRSILSMRT